MFDLSARRPPDLQNKIAIWRGGQYFVFFFDDDPATTLAALGRHVGDLASDARLPFTFGDGAKVIDMAARMMAGDFDLEEIDGDD